MRNEDIVKYEIDENVVKGNDIYICKSANRSNATVHDCILYTIMIKNISDEPLQHIELHDIVAKELLYDPCSLCVSVAYHGSITEGLYITESLQAKQCIFISYQTIVECMPNDHSLSNVVTVCYEKQDNHKHCEYDKCTVHIYAYQFTQQINDIIESVALEEAALAAILNAEGAKIQKVVSMQHITPAKLLCINQSVTQLISSVSILESILRKKLEVFQSHLNR